MYISLSHRCTDAIAGRACIDEILTWGINAFEEFCVRYRIRTSFLPSDAEDEDMALYASMVIGLFDEEGEEKA